MPESFGPDSILAVDLALLTEALGDPSLDLAALLGGLVSELAEIFPSLAGLAIILGGDTAYSISTLPSGVRVRSSLLLPLAGPDPGTSLLLYATVPHTFDADAAEFARLSGDPTVPLGLDQHLSAGTRSAATRSVQAASWVNQAVGVLIGLGATPEEAWSALRSTATAAATDEVSVAIDILDRLSAG